MLQLIKIRMMYIQVSQIISITNYKFFIFFQHQQQQYQHVKVVVQHVSDSHIISL